MKFLRTVLLPFLLLVLILLAGFFSPTLFIHLTSDLKNEVHTVEITGADSPLYLENTEELTLPPWDMIDVDAAVPYLSLYPDASLEDSVFSGLLRDWIVGVSPTAAPRYTLSSSELLNAIQTYDSAFLFLKDFRYPTSSNYFADNDEYALDLVISGREAAPLYLHVRPVRSETAPVSDADALRNDFLALLEYWQEYAPYLWENAGYDAEQHVQIFLSEISDAFPGTYVPKLASALAALLTQKDMGDVTLFSYTAFLWQEALISYQDIYTLTYDNETLLVLTDAQNHTYCLFYDGNTDRVTGYSIDAAAVGYTEGSEFSDAAAP